MHIFHHKYKCTRKNTCTYTNASTHPPPSPSIPPPHTHTDGQAHTNTHTHSTNTCITGDGLVEKRGKKKQISREEDSEEKWLTLWTERGREFQMTGPMYRKDLCPMVLLPTLRTIFNTFAADQNLVIWSTWGVIFDLNLRVYVNQ